MGIGTIIEHSNPEWNNENGYIDVMLDNGDDPISVAVWRVFPEPQPVEDAKPAPPPLQAHQKGIDWVLSNVDNLLAQAAEAGNEHRHHDEDISIRVAQVRATEAQAMAVREQTEKLEEIRRILHDTN